MRCLFLLLLPSVLASLVGCSSSRNDGANTTATTVVTPAPTQILTVASRPDWIAQMMSSREATEAKPLLTILSPQPNQTFVTTTIKIRLSLRGELKMYRLKSDTADRTVVGVIAAADHVHVVLDDLPYEDYYDLNKPLELLDVAPGKHTLRVFAARPWHESYKNEGAFQMVSFVVSGRAAETSRDKLVKSDELADPTKPLLTYNSPQGAYHDEAANPVKLIASRGRPKSDYQDARPDPIMIDFWLANAKLKGDGGEYLLRYIIDNDDPKTIDKWAPVWLKGWTSGKHTVRLELLASDGWPVKNGGDNVVTRGIMIVK